MSTAKVRNPRPRRMLDGFPPDTRVVIHEVTWDDFERFVDSIDEREICRVAIDGKDIEMMTLGPWHESEKSLLESFVAIVASELRIRRQPLGSTTWKRKKRTSPGGSSAKTRSACWNGRIGYASGCAPSLFPGPNCHRRKTGLRCGRDRMGRGQIVYPKRPREG
jgi:hypothetical protein